jgi:hypothetical protein
MRGSNWCLARYPRWAALLLAILAASVVVVPAVVEAPAARAMFASAGDGRYDGSIDWVVWNSGTISVGSGTTYNWTDPVQVGPNAWRSTQCAISSVTSALTAYIPGTYAGDALDKLYNIGGTGTANTMRIGLATADGQTSSFNFTCTAWLIISTQKPSPSGSSTSGMTSVSLQGLIVADAESMNSGEYINATPTGTGYTWRLVDSLRHSSCATNSLAMINGSVLSLQSSGTQCSGTGSGRYGPASVMFLSGATAAKVEMKGQGITAVALGVVIQTDFGDAPESYGVAASLFQPSWTGGQLGGTGGTDITASGGNYNLTSARNANTPKIATQAAPNSRLGATEDAEPAMPNSATATGDDAVNAHGTQVTGAGDEDGMTVPAAGITTAPGATYTSPAISCTGPGKLAGWIDWNRNGVFDSATEKSAEVTCSTTAGTTVSRNLTWTVPDDVKNSIAGQTGSAATFLRLRITNDSGTIQPTGYTTSGEVEDYQVQVKVSSLKLIKAVNNDKAGSAGLAADQWSLTGTRSGLTTPTVSGAGLTAETAVTPADYVLAEAPSTDPKTAGYTAGVWSCSPTVSGDTVTSTLSGSTITMRNQDRVTCTITNTAKPASLTWNKVDGTTALPGSEWTLTGPSYTSGTTITDCVAATDAGCTGLDKNRLAGQFRVSNLIWGEYKLVEKTAPVGYELDTTERKKTVNGASINMTEDFGSIADARSGGTLTWKKTDATTNALLGGSAWTLTDPSGIGSAVTDCVTTCTGLDVDPAAGKFKVSGLAWGSYTISELVVPTGYTNSGVTIPSLTLGATNLSADFGDIKNTRIPGALTWKKVDGSTPLAGSDWTLIGPDYPSPGTTVTDCVGSCTGLLDTDPVAGQFKVGNLSWGSYKLLERTAPPGYVLDTTERSKTIDASTPNMIAEFGNIPNTKITGTATWSKVDAGSTSTLLTGSEWTLTGPGSTAVTVTDCTASPCTGLLDTNPIAGRFKVVGLAWGDHTLTEKTAPSGFRLDVTEHPFTIATDGQVWDLGLVGNVRVEQITVIKQAANCDVGVPTCPLVGAQFALYDTDPATTGATPIVNGIAADASGSTFTSAQLPVDHDYWLVETKAPSKFSLLAQPVKFHLSATQASLDAASGGSLITASAFTITITDVPTGNLPVAGGAGFWPYLLIGVALLAGAGLLNARRPVVATAAAGRRIKTRQAGRRLRRSLRNTRHHLRGWK